jgi:hypothetical protein
MKFHVLCAGEEEEKYMRRQPYPSGVAAPRSTLIWRVFIRGTKLAPASRSHSGRYYFLCGTKGWPEGLSGGKKRTINEGRMRDEAELKWNHEGWEGNRVNRRRRYKNKKYCARKVLIVLFFALASLSTDFFFYQKRKKDPWNGQVNLLESYKKAGNVSYIHPARFNERYAMINPSLESFPFIYSAWDLVYGAGRGLWAMIVFEYSRKRRAKNQIDIKEAAKGSLKGGKGTWKLERIEWKTYKVIKKTQ